MTLTRRQKQVLKYIRCGGEVSATYLGGDPDDPRNWDFWMFIAGSVNGCAPTAASLVKAGLAKITRPNDLGYHYLAPT